MREAFWVIIKADVISKGSRKMERADPPPPELLFSIDCTHHISKVEELLVLCLFWLSPWSGKIEGPHFTEREN